VSEFCLTPFINFSAISRREQVNVQRNDNEVRFVLDQHPELDVYSSSYKYQLYSIWFYPTGTWNDNLPHSRRAR